jgi:predicted amidohydrolase
MMQENGELASMDVNIAVVQFAITSAAPEENLKKARMFVEEAAVQADMIVFPEDFVTGPLCGNRTLADYKGQYRGYFQELARQYAIDIVPGSIIEGDQDGLLYNTAYYIDKTGTIKGRYRKTNLWLPERTYLTPGDEVIVFDTEYGKVGLIICWDLIFPEVFRMMVRQGVEIVICPSYWCYEDAGVGLRYDANSEVKLVNALCVARAFENEVVVVYANAADSINIQQSQQERLIGQSQITVPFKGVLHLLSHAREEMFMQKVETDILRDAEAAYEIRKDLLERSGFISRL